MQHDPNYLDRWHMQRALELAQQGQGFVEPNPMVGCVVARGAETVGQGWHRRFGQAHAEIEALNIAGARALGATLYVTLEPCCHHGKTPPCTQAIVAAGVRRVVAAMRDPFPKVDGGGLQELAAAGIEVSTGLLEQEAADLNAPYLKLLSTGRPWVVAKWAMTLDGKIATASGASQWISNPRSRERGHALRGRMDAILIGRGTAAADNPQLTVRPPGARTPVRIVVDSRATLASDSRLVQTAREAPVLVAVGQESLDRDRRRLSSLGCEVLILPEQAANARLAALLDELGKRGMTNVLVEGGSRLLGAMADERLIDELHVFVAPKLFGGAEAPGPVGGRGAAGVADALRLKNPHWEKLDDDFYLHGRIDRSVE